MTVAGKIKSKIKEFFPTPLKTFGSYSEALAASGSGYEDNELVDVIVLKTQQNIGLLKRNLFFNQSLLSSLAGILYVSRRFSTINVIDLGGSSGLQYLMLRPLINEDTHINWTVVESKALADRCRSLFTTGELQFSDNLEEAIKNSGELHLVLCSGVIQYLAEPYDTLGLLAASRAHYLLFSRMCFSRQNRDVIILQKSLLSENGFGPMPPGFTDREIFYPQTSVQKEKFFRLLSGNYQPLFTFTDDSGVHYPEWQEGLGVLMERISN